jgi:ABC-type bacteriocin/lantibiotic exporter with double-glycine peptidase domain
MTKFLILGGLVVLVIGVMNFVPSVYNSEKETIEIEKEINVLDKRVAEAIESAQASTTAKAQAAFDKVVEEEKKRIEDEVKMQYIKEIEDTLSPE